jgi:hypothetical protein
MNTEELKDRIEIALWAITVLAGLSGLACGVTGYVITGIVFVAIAVAAVTLAGITKIVRL